MQSELLLKPVIEPEKPALEPEIEIKDKEIGHRWLYECAVQHEGKICRAKFKTLQELEKHHLYKHSYLAGACKYKIRIVNSYYIKQRMKQCKTRVLVFEHDHEQGIYPVDHDCEEHREVLNSCFIRICPKCAITRKIRSKTRFERFVRTFKRVSLLTLTVQGYHELSKENKNKFGYDIKKFLQMLKYHWGWYNLKYVMVTEIVYKKHGQYYYHYHFMIDMPYVKQAEITRMWSQATQGKSYVTDIRYVGNRWSNDNKLGYICKYLAKPFRRISASQYALHMYGTQFSKSFASLTSVASLVKRSMEAENFNGMMCKKCGYPLSYVRTVNLTEVKDLNLIGEVIDDG